jgi:hypothetical protein
VIPLEKLYLKTTAYKFPIKMYLPARLLGINLAVNLFMTLYGIDLRIVCNGICVCSFHEGRGHRAKRIPVSDYTTRR